MLQGNRIISGIYTIASKINNKIYLGCALNIYNRLSNHLSSLRKNEHKNNHLQAAWNKYGEDNFVFEILEECPEELLASEENHWANLLNVHNDKYGYNIRPTHPYGKIINTEEIRHKISESNKGKIPSLETINKIQETRRRNGKTKLSIEHKEKIGISNRGKKRPPVSESTRNKMRTSRLGKKMSNEFKEKLRIANTGKKLSQESREKMSLSKIGKRMKCHHIPVILMDHINNTNVEFECITDLAKHLNCATNQISKVISGKQKKVNGFKVIRKYDKV